MNITQYYILLGRYIQLHPALRHPNTEVLTYPAFLPKPLTSQCLRDGIHLSDSSNAVLANCIRQLAIRKASLCPALYDPVLPFSEWVESVTSTSITLSTQGDSTDATALTSNTTSMELDTTTDSLDLIINELNKADLI